MPMINITVALTSPMLADTFSVIRRAQVVGNNGRASTQNTTFPNLYGPVCPSTPDELRLVPDLATNEKAITVITRFALRGISETIDGTQYLPDVVVWKGDNFKVAKLQDWSNYGPGFVLAICTSIDLVDAPPAPAE
jgi:hypothetical protein